MFLDLVYESIRIDRFLDALAVAPGPVDPMPELVRLALDLVAATVFGVSEDIADRGILRTIDTHRRIIENYDLLDGLGAPSWLWSPKMWRARRVTADLDQRIHDAIARLNGAEPTRFDR